MKRKTGLKDITEIDEHENLQSHSSGTTIDYISPNLSEDGNSDTPKKRKTDWQIIKPTDKNGLYYDLLQSKEPDDLIQSWVDKYEIDPKQATVEIIQLIVDLCGYQSFKVEEFVTKDHWYNIVTKDLEKVVNPELEERGKYLIYMRNKNFKNYIEKIENFFTHVVLESHNRRILGANESWLGYVTSIIKGLCESKKRSVRHTAVFVGLKLMSGLIYVAGKMHNKLLKLKNNEEEDDEKLQRIKVYFKQVCKFLRILYQIAFKRNWNLNDKVLYVMRFDCISEIAKWLDFLPVYSFPNEEVLKILPAALKDGHKDVRFSTLRVLHKFFENEGCKENGQIKANLQEFTLAIYNRTVDFNSTNAAYAIEILAFIDNKHRSLPEMICEKTLELIYGDDFIIAHAAGRFLLQKLHNTAETDTKILLNIIRFQIRIEKRPSLKNMDARRPLVVDTLFEIVDIFTDINKYVDLLNSESLSQTEIEILADFLGETLLILTTGVPTYERTKMPKREVNNEKNINILKDVLRNVKLFSKHFKIKRLKYILKFLHEFKNKSPADFRFIANKV